MSDQAMSERSASRGSTRKGPSGGRRLADAFEAAAGLPALCESRRRLLAACEGSEVPVTEAVAIVESDPAMAIAIVQAVYDRGQGEVASIHGAVEALGTDGLREVARQLPTYDPLNGSWAAAKRGEAFRRHAIATRSAAEAVARLVRLEGREELATAALLHDAGQLVLASLYGSSFESISNGGRSPEERLRRERLAFGMDHALVGAVAMRRWGFSSGVASAIERHHARDARGHAGAIRLADLVAHQASGDVVNPGSLANAASCLGLEGDQVLRLIFEFPFAERTGPRAPRSCPLSARELDALQGLAEGKVYKQIANELTLSVSTIRTHLHNVYRKIGAVDRAQAVLIAKDAGWI